MKRRDFFKLSAIMSGAAVSACNNNIDEKILPYLVPPEDGVIPGIPRFIKSTCIECSANCGIEVKIREGKAVKLEGNVSHPVNKGGLCIRGQSSISRLYDPDRLKTPLLRSENGSFKEISWKNAEKVIKEKLEDSKAGGKKNVFFSSRLSGSFRDLTKEFCEQFDFLNLEGIETLNYSAIKKANKAVFNKKEVPQYNIEKSDLLVTFGADIIDTFLSPVEFSRKITEAKKNPFFKWFHYEEFPTLSGYSSSEKRTVKHGSEFHILSYLLNSAGTNSPLPAETSETVAKKTGIDKENINILLKAFWKARNPLVITGGSSISGKNGLLNSLLTSRLHHALRSIGNTVDFNYSHDLDSLGDFREINRSISSLSQDNIGVSIFSDLKTWPSADSIYRSRVQNSFKIAISELAPEKQTFYDLILPMSDNLESWGDTFPKNGIRSLIQPAVKPIYNTKSTGEILLLLMEDRGTWQGYLTKKWNGTGEDMISEGFRIEKNHISPVRVNNSRLIEEQAREFIKADKAHTSDNLLFLAPTIRWFDGRNKNIELLREIPDPVTSLTYGEYLQLSSSEAKAAGLREGDIVKITGKISFGEFPIFISPHLNGRTKVLPLSSVKWTDLSLIPASGHLELVLKDVKLGKTGERVNVPRLSGSFDTEGRGVIPGFDNEKENYNKDHHKLHTLYPEHEHKDYRWAMVINLDTCNGCSACVASCYIENNIPLTGKEEHIRGREMSWLRIEPYLNSRGEAEFLPMMCQQCDSAPCETVCPVYATYHNQEGLNAQVYNRCVGTRYCANNCPYKARRFNWFSNEDNMPLHGVSNPDVSVRPKGVMEKCTFCIQKIRYAKDKAKDEGRLVKDGEIQPACARSCPSNAILFGNLLDKNSEVSRLIREKEIFRVHESLGTKPAVYYIKGKQKRVLKEFEKKLENNTK